MNLWMSETEVLTWHGLSCLPHAILDARKNRNFYFLDYIFFLIMYKKLICVLYIYIKDLDQTKYWITF